MSIYQWLVVEVLTAAIEFFWVVFIHRKPETSVEDFQAYWRDEHSKVFSSIPTVKKNLLSYEKARGDADALQQLKDTSFGTIEADGMAIFEAKFYKKIDEVFTDEDYKKDGSA
ncbi:hypothetical protein ABVK25_010849 [Lepraria finkii]|uniref:EthD domain-containing protein n=1 Tax=Lepraria finkii TaxID=1340010 RepID=A0ABR4AT78_9LECA